MKIATNVQELRKQVKTVVGRFDFKTSRIGKASDSMFAKKAYLTIFKDQKHGKFGPFEASTFAGFDSCGHCRKKIFAQLKTFAKGK